LYLTYNKGKATDMPSKVKRTLLSHLYWGLLNVGIIVTTNVVILTIKHNAMKNYLMSKIRYD